MNLQAGLVRREEMVELQRTLSEHVNLVRTADASFRVSCAAHRALLSLLAGVERCSEEEKL